MQSSGCSVWIDAGPEISMMFDWIQKDAIFGYQRRTAQGTTGGRAARAQDILERSHKGHGMYDQMVMLLRIYGYAVCCFSVDADVTMTGISHHCHSSKYSHWCKVLVFL